MGNLEIRNISNFFFCRWFKSFYFQWSIPWQTYVSRFRYPAASGTKLHNPKKPQVQLIQVPTDQEMTSVTVSEGGDPAPCNAVFVLRRKISLSLFKSGGDTFPILMTSRGTWEPCSIPL